MIAHRGVPPRLRMRLPGSPTSSAVNPATLHNPVPCPGSPDTGVPNKRYRGAYQTRAERYLLRFRKVPANGAKSVPRLAGVTMATGHRGAQQGLPGCPTRNTGVPDKDYRGTRQVASEKFLQTGRFCEALRCPLCCIVLLFVMFCQQGEKRQERTGGR